MEEKIIKYTNDELTVFWKPERCIHSGICVKGLGQVFNPRIKKWVNMDAATSAAIANQIRQCPSGALSYQLAG